MSAMDMATITVLTMAIAITITGRAITAIAITTGLITENAAITGATRTGGICANIADFTGGIIITDNAPLDMCKWGGKRVLASLFLLDLRF